MSYNQPGPYGQQPPQQPGPYAQGAPAGQPGYGYPPPPPPPGTPYGAAPQQPQQPWGVPQQPQPGYPGQYPPPVPPQSGGGKGKAIGITIGAVAVVGALIAGAVYFMGGDGEVKPYTIVLPDKLLDGKYTKNSMSSPGSKQTNTQDLTDNAKVKELGISNGTSVSGSYTNAEKQALSVIGVYGELADPAKTVDAMIAKSEEEEKKSAGTRQGVKVETIAPWSEFSPSGFDGAVMKCVTKKTTVNAGTISVSNEATECIWGDSSAIGAVKHAVSKSNSPYGGTAATGNVMSTKEMAEAAAKVRNEVRKEK
ncbi:hypothetical protein FGW37_11005 [Streptomyces rectiverticillatus]|uniref:hypothetical protein n=1 Tax=Streptomyces rectiverticillatus TaxID=173860 RepID=UPI0015C2EB3F|nr:hypothetical protein [Streptomyces rectiverticillatus]QLE72063.1 hypothetical protein FGW37_11005 [Streptomyces rectiverticillatus]